jgi:hypothetical protein
MEFTINENILNWSKSSYALCMRDEILFQSLCRHLEAFKTNAVNFINLFYL